MIDWSNGFIQNPAWKEVAPDLLMVPFLTPELCEQIVEAGEKRADDFKPYGPDVANNAAPGQEMRLNIFDEAAIEPWKFAVEMIIYPIIRKYWWPLTLGSMRMPFIIRYDPEVQATLDPHHDASQVTINIPLTDTHQGGELIFPRQNRAFGPTLPPGHAILFPGRVTHVHLVRPVVSGIRYSLVHWLANKSDGFEDII